MPHDDQVGRVLFHHNLFEAVEVGLERPRRRERRLPVPAQIRGDDADLRQIGGQEPPAIAVPGEAVDRQNRGCTGQQVVAGRAEGVGEQGHTGHYPGPGGG